MAVTGFPSPSTCGLPLSHAAVPSSNPNRTLFFGSSFRSPLPLLSSSTTAFARRKKTSTPTPRKKSVQTADLEEDGIEEDAFEALFAQLEEDLKNDKDVSDDGKDDDVSEEDLALLEKELAEALGDVDIGDFSGSSQSDSNDIDSDSEEKHQKIPKLKNWQLRRLASALKIGRRKTNIKDLSAELGLDRALVLELLRNPPPNLIMMSAVLPDKIVESPVITEGRQVETLPSPEVQATPEPKKDVPVHVMHASWSKQKRLKKVQVATLEKVYRRTKRPTNSMISSIIYVTNLPWKTVVKWFEDRRLKDGVPEHRQPYQRPVTSKSSS